MDYLLFAASAGLILGVFWLSYRLLRQAQDRNNRNSNPDQSSYTDPPPG